MRYIYILYVFCYWTITTKLPCLLSKSMKNQSYR